MTVGAEWSLPLEALLRLPERGPAALDEVLTLARRGDWRARTLALSGAGVLVREDPTTRGLHLFRYHVARRVPPLKRRFPTTGARGKYAISSVANGLLDPVWIARLAAALAIGESRDARWTARLRPLVQDAFRPVRLGALAALQALGQAPAEPVGELLRGADAAPERVGDTALTLEWLAHLCGRHAGVLAGLAKLPGAPQPGSPDAQGWARLLAGELQSERLDSREAEIRRYAQEKDTHYHFTKPFTSVNRDQNVRLLHSFLVVAEQLRAPEQGLVLDLGGGSAWVSELLAKLGYRPVTLDLAPALLRVGRDRFTREHLPARLTAGDMTALPFGEQSFEAVVVIDALHHVPDVSQVFREAFRVLRAGGQFILAEPGEGHAETEKSRGEMAEHGVCEREIHLPEAVAYARAAGFDQVRVVPHYIPGPYFTPEGLRDAPGTAVERWKLQRDGQRVAFDEFVLLSVFSHLVLSCGKGQRALDTRMPRLLRAALEPQLERSGRRLSGRVRLENRGDTLWLKSEGDRSGHVRLGLQLMTPERRLIDQDWARGVLLQDVPPGGRAEVALDLELPDADKPYVVKLDLVDERICWFEDQGGKPVYVPV